MVRRRATAVIGNYMPLDQGNAEDMPYPKAVSNRDEKGKREANLPRKTRLSPSSPRPSDPTGRMVVTNVLQHGVGKGVGGSQVVHWCPKAEHDGQEWVCPDAYCQRTFIYEGDHQQWRQKQ